jgi:prepilin-type N-terminal cleavage/methylation domain-containing protein
VQLTRSRGTSAADRVRGQGGFTLIELMVVMMLFGIVISVIFAMLINVQKSETFAQKRGDTLDEVRVTMDRITKELRQATSVVGTPTASHIEFLTYENGTPADVTYDATGTTLTRKVGAATATTMQSGLTTTSLFTYVPSASTSQVVEIALVVTPVNLPATTVEIDGEIHLRNLRS